MTNPDYDVPDARTNYVDNKEFLRLILERKEKLLVDPNHRVCRHIGQILLDISSNLSRRRNFINYSFREDMVGDGVENCLTYLDNFDVSKSNNPFAYFTQICFYAFVRRITKEQKQFDVKGAVFENQSVEFQLIDPYESQNAFNDTLLRE